VPAALDALDFNAPWQCVYKPGTALHFFARPFWFWFDFRKKTTPKSQLQKTQPAAKKTTPKKNLPQQTTTKKHNARTHNTKKNAAKTSSFACKECEHVLVLGFLFFGGELLLNDTRHTLSETRARLGLSY
jgi:hypothetical protein